MAESCGVRRVCCAVWCIGFGVTAAIVMTMRSVALSFMTYHPALLQVALSSRVRWPIKNAQLVRLEHM